MISSSYSSSRQDGLFGFGRLRAPSVSSAGGSKSSPISRNSSTKSTASTASTCVTPSSSSFHEVLTVGKIEKDYDPISGRKVINKYEVIREVGRGVHGKVKLGRDLESNELVAIKIVDRTLRRRLGRPESSAQENKVRREIAILKKCAHPHIVRLKEVIDDPMSKKIYLVLEYVSNGEIVWHKANGTPALTIEQARQTFRDVVLGLEYLHYQGIIHRDIKPANLLWTNNHRTKISDFGVSHLSQIDQDANTDKNELELAKTAGTPAFFAPELCYVDISKPRPPITNAIDVWALGATLFCLLFGRPPFTADHEFELFNVIASQPLRIPDNPDIGKDARHLLRRLLEKDPAQRITLHEVKRHPWVLSDIENPVVWLAETDPKQFGDIVQLTPKELDDAVSLIDRLKRQLHKLSISFNSLTGGIHRRATTHSRSRKPVPDARLSCSEILRRRSVSDADPRTIVERSKSFSVDASHSAYPSKPTDSSSFSRLSQPSTLTTGLPRSTRTYFDLANSGLDESVEDEGIYLDFGRRQVNAVRPPPDHSSFEVSRSN